MDPSGGQCIRGGQAGISDEIPLWRDIFEYAPHEEAPIRAALSAAV